MMNIKRDLILNRFKKMDNLIRKLEEIKKYNRQEFHANFLLNLSAQRALETCINICIDIGNHILSLNKNGKPETYSEIFIELSQLNIISNDLKDKLIEMTKFRNLLGHMYMEIDNNIVYDILQTELNDFNLFKKQVLSKFKTQLSNKFKE